MSNLNVLRNSVSSQQDNSIFSAQMWRPLKANPKNNE